MAQNDNATQRPAPATQRPAPATQRPARATQRPAPATQRPASATQQPAPATWQPAEVSGESRVLHRKSQNVCRSFEKQSMSKTIEIMIRRTHPKLPVGALEIGVFIKPPKLWFDKAT